MRISAEKLKKACESKSLNLGLLLKKAGVSKTAYYALVRKDDILPRSIRAIAGALGVSASAFLEEQGEEGRKMRRILKRVDAIMRGNPELDRDNVRHTLIMLSMKPIDRLRRGLIRGRKIDIH